MNVNEILTQVDEYYGANRGADAEKLMLQGIATAVEEGEDEALLQLLNELLGYYRETSQVENSYAIAAQAIAQAEKMGLADTIPYATTLLNVANAYRAGGKLKESLDCYLKVRRIYDAKLKSDNMLVASFENNLSLLYQEMGEFAKAKESLLKALDIVLAKNAEFEIAVTYANLAGTCMELGELSEAYGYAKQALEDFESIQVQDAHYGAALSAMGTYYFKKQKFARAREYFAKAMRIMEQNLGRNEYYERLRENVEACDKELVDKEYSDNKSVSANSEADTISMSGLALAEAYYEAYGKPMIEEQFAAYQERIAVGLVGEGSDCFGYDDELSRDHDWGPDFCLWLADETYAEIGEALQRAYESLPEEYMGYRRTRSVRGMGRRGVMTISSFYKRFLGMDSYEDIAWGTVSDAALATAVNGKVFRDAEGIFSAMRKKLLAGYPEPVKYLKLAEGCAAFSQAGQYNFERMLKRGDELTAMLMLSECMKSALRLQHYIGNTYPPHDKWLYRSGKGLPGGEALTTYLENIRGKIIKAENASAEKVIEAVEELGAYFAHLLYQENLISDTDSYLDAHTDELLQKAHFAGMNNEELVERIARLEFEAFDKVQNVGGRADCQNDWMTFSIMRKSQYRTWNRTMLLQYLYDFEREYRKGHNLITEKYGRMMESTAPEEYERICENFPVLSGEKKAIIEHIVQMQVGWMEAFAVEYPHLADNARSVRSSEDNLYNTSYETYLRGELGTYSDKMLELYGRYVVEYATGNRNLTYEIMENSVKLYGYKNMEEAERFLGL